MKLLITLLTTFFPLLIFAQSENDLVEVFEKSFKENDSINQRFKTLSYIQPHYLISDFNGDGVNDIAVLIVEKATDKRGFIVLHPNTNKFFIIGAGEVFNHEDQWDDLNWVNQWTINTTRSNEPGIQEGPNLELKTDSIKIIKFDVGGGLIYWDGEKYNYFHQTC
ncbi:hypothetical protein [Flammeovirga sp. OC4]|uniref:hypothetical protein n=1 Tax=Flammeovirga sp. OC4 TaxID=1382345 RepID=UPI0005C74286|nr:hypothetical protein [Flammeovirga sp. OC4]